MRAANIALVVISCAVAGLAAEAALRFRIGVPLLSVADLRGAGVMVFDSSEAAVFDPALGWTQKPNFRSAGLNTIAFGIRRNKPDDNSMPGRGEILAVGDSFTVGSDVVDEESWPARLSRAINVRVLNAGVGGYGVDQSALRAELLLPAVKPRLLILGIFEEDILRSGFAAYSAAKPYFEKTNGGWALRNSPVPPPPDSQRAEPFYKLLLARFAGAHLVMNKFAFPWWYSNGRNEFRRSSASPAEASCHTVDRLASMLKSEKIPGAVVFQYSAETFRKSQMPAYVGPVLECAQNSGLTVVDAFPALNRAINAKPEELRRYFVYTGNSPGHMSAAGNEFIAKLVATRIAAQLK